MKNVKTIIKFFFDISVVLILFFNLLIKLFNFLNIRKILNCKSIYFFTQGGFGHQFWILDHARYLEKKKDVLVILFIDNNRHNKYLTECFDLNFIQFKSCINLLNIRFGEYEGNNIIFLISFLKYLTKNIFRKNILMNNEIYLKLNNKILCNKFINIERFKKIKSHQAHQKGYYYQLINEKLKSPNLPNNLKNLIENKYKILNKENFLICTLYLRNSNNRTDFSAYIRNGNKLEEYVLLIEYLIKNRYNIFLVGDYNEKYINFGNFKKNIFTHKDFKVKKKIFELFAAFNHHMLISECGGYHNLGYYSRFAIGVNFFPYGYHPPNYLKILNKKLFKNKNEILSQEHCENNYHDVVDENIYKKNNIEIRNNSVEEIIFICKSLIK